MAKIRDLQETGWSEWLATRPEVIQDLAARLPPDRLYLLRSSGHRVFLYSYSEDGTVTVVVSGQYNLVAFERRVFGISPADLEECDLPAEDEVLGVVLDEEETEALLGRMRESRELEDAEDDEPDRCFLCLESDRPLHYDGLFLVCEDCDGGEEQARAHHDEGRMGEAGL